MAYYEYKESPFAIRQDLVDAYREYWQALSMPGNWFSGAERVAVAAEVRHALDCPFCAQRKQALSPYTMEGEHLAGEILPDRIVDAVHRVVTDQSRITPAWIEDNAAHGLGEEQYAELVGIVVAVFSIDEFNRALGLAPEPLPEPLPGEPDHYRPAQAQPGNGFLQMLPAEGATGAEADLWPAGSNSNVLRALSLVPDAVRSWKSISNAQYLPFREILQFGGDTGRALNRMQIELVAGRVSSINECFY